METIDKFDITPAQTKLIEENLEYAQRVSSKVARSLPLVRNGGTIRMDIEDIQQIGTLGLIQAAQRFSPETHDTSISIEDKRFRSFAYRRIVGSILDECRKQTNSRRRDKDQQIILTSLDFTQDDGTLGTYDPQSPLLDMDEWLDMRSAIGSLDDKESRIVLGLMAGESGREIAREFGVTESRISQIATQARAKLKGYLEP